MTDKIEVYFKEPGKNPKKCKIENTLEELQKLVGGYIEVKSIPGKMAILWDEEGRLKSLPLNVKFGAWDIVGNIVLVGVKGSDFCSVPATDAEIKSRFWNWYV